MKTWHLRQRTSTCSKRHWRMREQCIPAFVFHLHKIRRPGLRLEVVEMSSIMATKIIGVLCHIFATYGLPVQVVTDNGPLFVAEEFAHFLKSNGMKHIKSSQYNPSTNGLAERFVQTLKSAMKIGAADTTGVSLCLEEFLLSYRSTPHTTTFHLPSELFLGRPIHT